VSVHNAVSRADWCNRLAEVWLWPLLSSSITDGVTTITILELSDTLRIWYLVQSYTPNEGFFKQKPAENEKKI
jgi:hypothetical protein